MLHLKVEIVSNTHTHTPRIPLVLLMACPTVPMAALWATVKDVSLNIWTQCWSRAPFIPMKAAQRCLRPKKLDLSSMKIETRD